VRRAGRIGADEDLDALDVPLGDLPERHIDDRLVVLSGVGAGIPGPQQTAERLAGLIQVDLQRVKPVAALVVTGRLLLLGVRGDQRRVDVDRQPLRRAV